MDLRLDTKRHFVYLEIFGINFLLNWLKREFESLCIVAHVFHYKTSERSRKCGLAISLLEFGIDNVNRKSWESHCL